MTTTQADALTTTQVGSLKASQIDNLQSTEVQAFASTQLGALDQRAVRRAADGDVRQLLFDAAFGSELDADAGHHHDAAERDLVDFAGRADGGEAVDGAGVRAVVDDAQQSDLDAAFGTELDAGAGAVDDAAERVDFDLDRRADGDEPFDGAGVGADDDVDQQS